MSLCRSFCTEARSRGSSLPVGMADFICRSRDFSHVIFSFRPQVFTPPVYPTASGLRPGRLNSTGPRIVDTRQKLDTQLQPLNSLSLERTARCARSKNNCPCGRGTSLTAPPCQLNVFGRRMGGGGRRKALFQKGFLLPPHSFHLILSTFPPKKDPRRLSRGLCHQ